MKEEYYSLKWVSFCLVLNRCLKVIRLKLYYALPPQKPQNWPIDSLKRCSKLEFFFDEKSNIFKNEFNQDVDLDISDSESVYQSESSSDENWRMLFVQLTNHRAGPFFLDEDLDYWSWLNLPSPSGLNMCCLIKARCFHPAEVLSLSHLRFCTANLCTFWGIWAGECLWVIH